VISLSLDIVKEVDVEHKRFSATDAAGSNDIVSPASSGSKRESSPTSLDQVDPSLIAKDDHRFDTSVTSTAYLNAFPPSGAGFKTSEYQQQLFIIPSLKLISKHNEEKINFKYSHFIQVST
jgi:hypothetical protein